MRGAVPASATIRSPGEVMRLSRLGRFHPTRLSFARVLIRRMAREGWRIETAVHDLDDDGHGRVAYDVHTPAGVLGFAAFSHHLDPADRTDRVIAERWDASFALTLEPPTPADLDRLQDNVPRQEAGRCGAGEIVLSRANRSVRLFDEVVSSLAAGGQPSRGAIGRVGYLMRTTAVYGNGKFGLADFEQVRRRGILTLPFQAEMLTVYLARHFSLELVDYLAARRGGSRAAALARSRRRALGVGNATGLGMAPFLVNRPQLIGRWIRMRETALARVKEVERAEPPERARFRTLLARARTHVDEWRAQVGDAALGRRLATVARRLAELEGLAGPDDDANLLAGHRPWAALAAWAGDDAETGELLNSILVELYPDRVDDLETTAGSDEREEVRPGVPVEALRRLIEDRYGWALEVDFDRPDSRTFFWYYSQEKEEPRLGFRYEEPGADQELRLGIARQAAELHRALESADPAMPVGRFPPREPRVPPDRATRPIPRRLALCGDPREPARRGLRTGGAAPRKARDAGGEPIRSEVAPLDAGDLLSGSAARGRAGPPRRGRLGIRDDGRRPHRVNRAERLHVSLAELRTAASRALHGAGAPPGTERDGARSAVWLEARGLGGAVALVSELDAVARAGSRPPPLTGHRVDLAGGPILVWGSTLIEIAMLEAGTPIVISGCRTPRVLIPEAVAQTSAGRGWHFQLEAGAGRALVADGETILDRSFVDLDAAGLRLVAAEGPPRTDLPPAPPRSRLTTPELEARHAASLASGLRLGTGDWRAIRDAAARILVPATERSRSRGAGAEVDDNE